MNCTVAALLRNPRSEEEAVEVDRRPRMGFSVRVLRRIAVVVAVLLGHLTVAPLAQAAIQSQNLARGVEQTAVDEYGALLSQIQVAADAGQWSEVKSLATKLETEKTKLEEEWAGLAATWQAAGVSGEVINRQKAVEAALSSRHAALKTLLSRVDDAAGQVALRNYLNGLATPSTASLVDLENLPWQVEKGKAREALEDGAALDAALKLEAQTAATTFAAPQTQQARLLRGPASPQASPELSITLDAPQSAEIRALAVELGNNPYKIHQWVYDNIRFFPSYGSVQGAEETLAKKSGNAFDIASLLIALLRSAGIESRYVYGTVQIPSEQAMNWVGGVKTPEVAQQILGQGGIPNTGLASGGKIVMIRLEHVWVEAWIKFHPERGIDHAGGISEGDSWVPLDASFKQYTYTERMDLQEAVPFDAEALINAAQQGAEVNEAEGWVRNVNQAAVESRFKAYQQQLKTYLEQQNNGQSTVGDVLGAQRIQINPLPYLAGTLPYTVQATASRFAEIPDNLRAKFRYRIYASQNDRYYGSDPILNFEAPTATLAGKKVTLTWVAADENQQRALEALIPTPQPGQQLNPNDLPKTIPASIRLKPQIRVDGELKADGTAQNVGNEPIGAGAFTRYGTQQWDESADQLIVGQQTAIGLSIQGVSQKQIETLKTRMEQTKVLLESVQALPPEQQAEALQGLTGEHITGDLLTATIWGYYASLQSYGTIAASQAEMIDLPGLSFGLLHVQVSVKQLYGLITTGVVFEGLNLDMGHLRYIRWVKDDNPASAINAKPELTQNGKTATQNRWIAYNRQHGQYMSAMEHAVPEAFWVDKSQCRYVDETGQVKNPALPDCAQAISAVKAIAIAQSQGQKIYTITPQNASTALARLPISGSVGQEIRNAVNAGKEVTIHEKPISAYGWSGYGYSIIDPETGEGGYIIEGSGNGGLLLILTGALVLLALQQLIYFAPYLLSPAGVVLLFSLGTLLIVSGLAILHKNYELCMYAMNGIIAGIGFAIALPETPLGAVLAVFLVPVLEGFVQEKICESAK